MGILCKLFGHKFQDQQYAKVRSYDVDGINREHASIKAECDRCGEEYFLCNIHLPPREAEKRIRKRLEEAEKLLHWGSGPDI